MEEEEAAAAQKVAVIWLEVPAAWKAAKEEAQREMHLEESQLRDTNGSIMEDSDEIRGQILQILLDCPSREDKALGPNGFPPFFFHRYWSIVSAEVTKAVQMVFGTRGILEQWKRMLIILIPKRLDTSAPGYFRPISLYTILYKWIPDRRRLMEIKLDMERVYDRMSWRFVWQTLQEFGFHDRWTDWVMDCMEGPSFAILINGSPIDSGDELEPYWSVLGMQLLLHLLFADDCLLIDRISLCNTRYFASTMEAYYQMSGQCMNLQKSTIIFSPKMKVQVKHVIRDRLKIFEQIGTLTYLGVPIMSRRLQRANCKLMGQKIQEHLDGWQAHSFSMLGRATLVRVITDCTCSHRKLSASLCMMGAWGSSLYSQKGADDCQTCYEIPHPAQLYVEQDDESSL
uniref:Uncharacterized protein LOC105042984 n=1 Tax=Elaeis guineensis var. tenera TaxID=51953 RepID=A0A6I9R118_ELAGV|nr:uncharacterized protein LOC105042984 [Elaeis guineensis]